MHWSGKRGSNPRHPPWQGGALPLSYSRSEGRKDSGRSLPGSRNGPPRAARQSISAGASWRFFAVPPQWSQTLRDVPPNFFSGAQSSHNGRELSAHT